MTLIINFIKKNYQEIIFQIILFVILFLFYSFDRYHSEKVSIYKVSFFINYATAAFIINYLLLPKLYYKKKFIWFFLTVLLLIIFVILIEEFILEQIYFPETRGKHFPGFIYSLVDTLPVIIIFVAFKFAWDFNKKQSEIEALKISIKESELQFLKSQINPHFLFNNLNNLYAYALEKSPKTPSIILELSSVLRYMLYDCKEEYVPLNKEIDHLKNFTALNKLQIEQKGDIRISTNVMLVNYSIAPLILMVFIENAFKHSTASQSENIFINISINVSEKGQLKFTCENSFLSKTNTDHISKGIGLENVKKRLLLLYPKNHKLIILNEKGIFKVSLNMQLTV